MYQKLHSVQCLSYINFHVPTPDNFWTTLPHTSFHLKIGGLAGFSLVEHGTPVYFYKFQPKEGLNLRIIF